MNPIASPIASTTRAVPRDADIVVGLGFGDEGKGRCTSWLVNRRKTDLVVRYSGGHQAGHTVWHGGQRHVFSNFGSGTLQGVPTFWSQYCPLNPVGFCNEYNALFALGVKPKIYIDPRCPVTTPYDILANRAKAQPGSTVGVGITKTWQRHKAGYSLLAGDLLFPEIVIQKIRAIVGFYNLGAPDPSTWYDFIHAADFLVKHAEIMPWEDMPTPQYAVFEGSQGILLDEVHGFFPDVTWGSTSAKNAVQMCADLGLDVSTLWGVTRTYQTRHGNGYMTNLLDAVTPQLGETNVNNAFQGEFRCTKFDVNLFRYAVKWHIWNGGAAYYRIFVTGDDFIKAPPDLASEVGDRAVYSLGPRTEDGVMEYGVGFCI